MASKNINEEIFCLDEEDISTEYKNMSDVEKIKDRYGLVEQVAREVSGESIDTGNEELSEEQKALQEEFDQEMREFENSKEEPALSEKFEAEIKECLDVGSDVEYFSDQDLSEELNEEKTTFLSASKDDPVLKNLSTGEVFKISSNPYTIGKQSSCSLCISDKVVSRHHAEIAQYGDKYFIRDLGSTNGTFINGMQLPKNTDVELKNNQEIIFANKKFKFHA